MKIVNDFKDFELLDTTEGIKLERWGSVILARPDPGVIWASSKKESLWKKAHATYIRENTGGGHWQINHNNIPLVWQIQYQDLTFNLKRMNFKHTGLFPEQAYNWNIIRNKIKTSNCPIKVLNLFAYTGAASVAALKQGAEVVHVDSSKGMVDWAKENVASSGLKDKPIRFIVDDVRKFVKREIRRENHYDIIIMDPPSFGRGKSGEVWDIEKDLFELVGDCTKLLSEDPILFLINSYTTSLPLTALRNILLLTVNKKYPGFIDCDELGLPQQNSSLILPCGIYARWEKEKSDI